MGDAHGPGGGVAEVGQLASLYDARRLEADGGEEEADADYGAELDVARHEGHGALDEKTDAEDEHYCARNEDAGETSLPAHGSGVLAIDQTVGEVSAEAEAGRHDKWEIAKQTYDQSGKTATQAGRCRNIIRIDSGLCKNLQPNSLSLSQNLVHHETLRKHFAVPEDLPARDSSESKKKISLLESQFQW